MRSMSARSRSSMPLLLILFLAGCARDEEPLPETEIPDTVAQGATTAQVGQVPIGPADTVRISFDGAGDIVVDPDSLVVSQGRVHWRAEGDSAAPWVVVFGWGDTPFQTGAKKRFVFNGPSDGSDPNDVTGSIAANAPPGVRKYTVLWPADTPGNFIMKDPKLVIREEPDTGAVAGGDSDR